ncbi:MAG: Nif3-like dinuclear metal center hexameric protein, partial [Giesbergeria sp.]
MTISRETLQQAFDVLLQPDRFKDYGPNGLQVEGRAQIGLLVSGVTASRALIDAAIDAGADAIFVHHGLFWRGQDGRVTGWMKQRLQRLLAHDINLFAYHLPLDAHPELGNNARLGAELGWASDAHFGEQNLGCLANVQYTSAAELCADVGRVLGREPLCVAGHTGPVTRVGWCTGGAQGYFEAAAAAGAQVYLTGEISEPQAHLAREMGVGFIAAGHHATERYGAPA